MALTHAGLTDPVPDPEETGVVIGTGMGGFEKADESIMTLRQHGVGRVNPFAVPSSLANMPSHHVSLMAGTLKVPISSVVAACATGTQAIGEGCEFIRRGSAHRVLAGGVEGLIHLGAVAGFIAMRGLTLNFNERPEKASRPFDKDRDGFYPQRRGPGLWYWNGWTKR